MQVGVHEAKTNFSELLRRVALGEEVVITRSGEPVARLIGAATRRAPRLGLDVGKVVIRDDFDAPLDADTMAGFEA